MKLEKRKKIKLYWAYLNVWRIFSIWKIHIGKLIFISVFSGMWNHLIFFSYLTFRFFWIFSSIFPYTYTRKSSYIIVRIVFFFFASRSFSIIKPKIYNREQYEYLNTRYTHMRVFLMHKRICVLYTYMSHSRLEVLVFYLLKIHQPSCTRPWELSK